VKVEKSKCVETMAILISQNEELQQEVEILSKALEMKDSDQITNAN